MHHDASSANSIALKTILGIMTKITEDKIRKEIFAQPEK